MKKNINKKSPKRDLKKTSVVKEETAQLISNINDESPKPIVRSKSEPLIRQQTNGDQFLKKHEYISRVSILDDFEPTSLLKQSRFMGMYNCIYVLVLFYFVTSLLLKYKEKGVFFDRVLMNILEKDILIVAITWPLFYLWSHIALLLQYLTLLKAPHYIIQILQHSSQSCMFLYCHYLVTTREWQLFHGIFVTFQSCVFFMKMHSYTDTNQKLSKLWIKEGSPVHSDPYKYPNNINFNNFTLFMWIPVLVYETKYPRTNEIRWKYVFRKLFYTFAILNVDYLIVQESVMPVILDIKKYSVLHSIQLIILPMLFFCLLTFFMIFENLCNFFAEITRFSDRLFYQDWWNASNYDEFNRKWNRPVHEFLYRHIYLESIWVYGYSLKQAQLVTFLFSALLHEYILAVSMQKISPIMTLFMLFQIPLMFITKWMKGTQLGNQVFWCCQISGLPIIINLYVRQDEMQQLGLQTNFI